MRKMAVGEHWVQQLSSPRALRCLVAFVLAGAVLYLGGMVWSGWGLVVAAFGQLGLAGFAIGAGVASCAYLIRFVRWHVALHLLGHHVPRRANLRIYLSGLALTASPGKIGETFRSVLLVPFGVPASHSLGGFLADRLSDVVGICLLGALVCVLRGATVSSVTVALVAIVVGSFVFRWAVGHPRWWAALVRQPHWIGASGRLGQDALLSWARLWRPLNVLLFSGAAMLAYGLQASVFAWFCHLLDLQIGTYMAIEIFVNATLLGAASMVPGGLGAMEAALVVQLVEQGSELSMAMSAAVSIRFVTLWMSIFIGLCALLAGVSPRRGGAL